MLGPLYLQVQPLRLQALTTHLALYQLCVAIEHSSIAKLEDAISKRLCQRIGTQCLYRNEFDITIFHIHRRGVAQRLEQTI